MEPPDHHCLGWEWVSRKHMGGWWWVLPDAACLPDICLARGAAYVGGWEAEKVPFTASCLHLLHAGQWVWHTHQSPESWAPEHVGDCSEVWSLGTELECVVKLNLGVLC